MAKPTKDQQRMCDELQRDQPLRAAVAWRYFQGKADILSQMTGVPYGVIETFVKDGVIPDRYLMALEAFQ